MTATGAFNPLAPSTDMVICGLLTTDVKGNILWANKAICSWLGVSQVDVVEKKKKLQDFLTMGGRIFHQTHWHPLLQLQGSVSEVKLDFVTSDRKTLPMVLNAVRCERARQTVYDVALFVARDRDRYEHELLSSRAKLESQVAEVVRLEAAARDRALYAEQMVGIVSHDLRNPLSAIQLGVHGMRKTVLDERQQRMLDRVDKAASRANRLIADLLDFTISRIGSGIPVAPVSSDLHKVIADTVAEMVPTFQHRRLQHCWSGQGSSWFDPDRISQVVSNLVGNAMAYGDALRDVTVTSNVESSLSWVSVHNHGNPISPEAITRLFNPMVRGATGGLDRSVGLGLYIVSEIAKAHGGEVKVTSSERDGTTFKVLLPAAQIGS